MANKSDVSGEIEDLAKVWQNYSLLDQEIKLWQKERGAFWQEALQPEAEPPYYPVGNFPEAVVLELWQRLNKAAQGTVSETELKEAWQAFRDEKAVPAEGLLSSLMISLKGIAELCRAKFGEGHELDLSVKAKAAPCPVCGEMAVLSVLRPPAGKRFLLCTVCGHEWPVMRSACIRCGNQEPTKQNYLNAKEFPGVEVVVCDACGQYFKEFDLRLLAADDFMWEDMRTLPLNYAAEQWLGELAKKNGSIQ